MTEAAAFDETYYNENCQNQDRPALWMYERMVRRLVPHGARVLEFGAGHGYFSKRLADTMHTSALDISPYARAQIAKVSPHTTVLDPSSQIGPGSFDLIVSLHVLEHLPDPSAVLAGFHRWLRADGWLFFVVPNPDGWGRALKRDEWFAFRDPTHCTLWSQRRWLDATEAAGFSVSRTASDGLWDPPYVRRIPAALQRPLFGLGAAATLLTARMILPPRWGECLIVAARRR